jgi:hypothetical protein
MEQPIPARPEQAMTDPEQAYQIGLQDGYQLAKKQLQTETDKTINRLNAKTAGPNAEAHAVASAHARRR